MGDVGCGMWDVGCWMWDGGCGMWDVGLGIGDWGGGCFTSNNSCGCSSRFAMTVILSSLVDEAGENDEFLVEIGGLGFVLDTVTAHLGFLVVPGFDHLGIGSAIGSKE